MHIPIKYGRIHWLLVALGMGPRFSGIDVAERHVRVRMSYAFRLKADRSAITSVEEVREGIVRRFAGGIGVHGWRGAWRVNGASRPIVRICFDPTQHCRVLGFKVHVHTLDLSVEDPTTLIEALR